VAAGCRLLVLGLLDHRRFGGDEQRRNRGCVLQGRATIDTPTACSSGRPSIFSMAESARMSATRSPTWCPRSYTAVWPFGSP
jgi:hypothetical protein